MAEDATLQLNDRTTLGKGLGKLRKEGLVPAVIHNHGKPSVHVAGPAYELNKIYQTAGRHQPVEIKVGSDKYLALIKDAHFNPVKRSLDHVVFQAINRNEKVHAEVPLHIEGDAPAEKVGLMVLTQLDHVEVEAFPRNLPEQLSISAENLAELHDAITVGDLQVPEGVTILTEADHPIARVVETPAQASEEAAEASSEEGESESAEGNAESNDSGNESNPAKEDSNS
jgi:large subunit ribosomal protein L25